MGQLVSVLSDAMRHTRREFERDGVLDAVERRILRLHAEALHIAQTHDDDLAEGLAIARYGTVLPYHAKRRRMTASANICAQYDEPDAA
jgi:hypothetical protein